MASFFLLMSPSKFNFQLAQRTRTALAVLLCTVLAWIVALFSAGRPWRAMVPFLFLLVILGLGLLCGRTAGILSSLAAALVFAHSLYKPLGQVQVSDPSLRMNLAWMALAGVSLSFLLQPEVGEPHKK